jgi:hypothetical protein
MTDIELDALLEKVADERNGDSLLANLARTAIPKLVEALRAARLETRMQKAHLANPGRVIAWAMDPNRKPAVTAFTEGPERLMATLIERDSHG